MIDINSINSTTNIPSITVISQKLEKSNSVLVESQLPDYVKIEYPKFIEFLEYYYRSQDRSGGTRFLLTQLEQFIDINNVSGIFLEFIKKHILNDFPQTLGNQVQTIKNIIHFYRAKGTEESYRYLFRILYDKEIEFYYPRVDLFRLSSGNFIQNYSIRVSITGQGTSNIGDLVNQEIKGQSSLSTATVEYINSFVIGSVTVYELFLNKSSLKEQFFVNESVVSESFPDLILNVYPTIISFDFVDRGSGYSLGATITSNFNLPNVEEFTGIVSSVDTLGNVLEVSILNPGFNIPIGSFDNITNDRTYSNILSYSNSGDNQLHVIPKIRTIIKYRGFYLDDSSHLSSSKKLHDGIFYQQFSYVIKTSESLSDYKEVVTDLVHPCGLKLFGDFVIEDFVQKQSRIEDVSNELVIVEKADVTRLDSSSDIELQITSNTDENQSETILRSSFGMSYYMFDLLKFTFLPNGGNDENRMVLTNSNYWSNDLANYQLHHFFDLVIADFVDNPSKIITTQPEPILTQATSPVTDAPVDVPNTLP